MKALNAFLVGESYLLALFAYSRQTVYSVNVSCQVLLGRPRVSMKPWEDGHAPSTTTCATDIFSLRKSGQRKLLRLRDRKETISTQWPSIPGP